MGIRDRLILLTGDNISVLFNTQQISGFFVLSQHDRVCKYDVGHAGVQRSCSFCGHVGTYSTCGLPSPIHAIPSSLPQKRVKIRPPSLEKGGSRGGP